MRTPAASCCGACARGERCENPFSTKPASTLLWLAVGTVAVGTIYYFATRPTAAAQGPQGSTNPQGIRVPPGGIQPPPGSGRLQPGSGGGSPIAPGGLPFPPAPPPLPPVDINQVPGLTIDLKVGQHLKTAIPGFTMRIGPNPRVLRSAVPNDWVAVGAGRTQIQFADADGTLYDPYTITVVP